MFRPTTTIELADQYIAERDVAAAYATGFRYKVARFAAWVGYDTPAAFTEDNLNGFLASLKPTLRPATVKNYRGDLIVFWRWLADRDLAEYPRIRRVVRPHVPAPIPDCWSLDEVRALLRAAQGLTGRFLDGTDRAAYWTAAILVGYETGLRRSDVWQVRRSGLLADGRLVSVARKTGRRTVHQLSLAAVAALRQLDRPLPLHYCYNQRRWGVHFDRIVVAASVRRGTWKWLRRASGSYVAADHGEAAGAEHLGHTSVATFRRFYDARLVQATRPQPPLLTSPQLPESACGSAGSQG